MAAYQLERFYLSPAEGTKTFESIELCAIVITYPAILNAVNLRRDQDRKSLQRPTEPDMARPSFGHGHWPFWPRPKISLADFDRGQNVIRPCLFSSADVFLRVSTAPGDRPAAQKFDFLFIFFSVFTVY